MSIPQMEFKALDMEPPQEPRPGQKGKNKRGRRTNASIEAQIRDELESFMQLAALFWAARDDVCSAALSQQAPFIAEDLAALAMKSEWARKYLTKTLDGAALMPLMMHSLPLFQTIRAHHMSPPEESENATGEGSVE